jgi:hypothetical protein
MQETTFHPLILVHPLLWDFYRDSLSRQDFRCIRYFKENYGNLLFMYIFFLLCVFFINFVIGFKNDNNILHCVPYLYTVYVFDGQIFLKGIYWYNWNIVESDVKHHNPNPW